MLRGMHFEYIIIDELGITSPTVTKEMIARIQATEVIDRVYDNLDNMLITDERKREENRNSFIKQQKLNEAKQARKDQIRRGKR